MVSAPVSAAPASLLDGLRGLGIDDGCASCAATTRLSTLDCAHRVCGPCVGKLLVLVDGPATCPAPSCGRVIGQIRPPASFSSELALITSPTKPPSPARRFSTTATPFTPRRSIPTESTTPDASPALTFSSSVASSPNVSQSPLFHSSITLPPPPQPSQGPFGDPAALVPAHLTPFDLLRPDSFGIASEVLLFPTVQSYAVLRIDNVPWLATTENVRQWLMHGSRPVDEVLPSATAHPLSIHLLCDRRDGRTHDSAFVEVVDEVTARRLTRELRGHRMLNRVVGVHQSSQHELMAALFPRSMILPAPFNDTATVNVNADELEGILDLCKLESPHSVKVMERPFLQIVSMWTHLPFDDQRLPLITVDLRSLLVGCMRMTLIMLLAKLDVFNDWKRIADIIVSTVMSSTHATRTEKEGFVTLVWQALANLMPPAIRAPTPSLDKANFNAMPAPPAPHLHSGPLAPSNAKAVFSPIRPRAASAVAGTIGTGTPRGLRSASQSGSILPSYASAAAIRPPGSVDELSRRDRGC